MHVQCNVLTFHKIICPSFLLPIPFLIHSLQFGLLLSQFAYFSLFVTSLHNQSNSANKRCNILLQLWVIMSFFVCVTCSWYAGHFPFFYYFLLPKLIPLHSLLPKLIPMHPVGLDSKNFQST